MICTRAAMPTGDRRRAAAADSYRSYQPPEPPGLQAVNQHERRGRYQPYTPEPQLASAHVPASRGRHTIVSGPLPRVSYRDARGGTATARSSGSIGGIVRGHRADHRLNYKGDI